MGAHRLSDAEGEALNRLVEAGLVIYALEFHVATVYLSPAVHDAIAEILDKHAGRRRVILCCHSGDREPIKMEMQQRASSRCVPSMTAFLGRFAV